MYSTFNTIGGFNNNNTVTQVVTATYPPFTTRNASYSGTTKHCRCERY